jgi:hypothetical protein
MTRATLRDYTVLSPILGGIILLVTWNLGTIMAVVLKLGGFEDTVLARYSGESMGVDLEERFGMASDVFQVWSSSLSSILFGLGTTDSFAIAGSYTHIVPLEVVFEQGVFVGVLYLFALARTFLAIAKMLDLPTLDACERRLAIFLSAQFGVLFLISLKQGALYNNFNILSLSIFCIVLSNYLRRRNPRARLALAA